MNISDLLERGNPEGEEDVLWLGQEAQDGKMQQNEAGNGKIPAQHTKMSRNLVVVAILLLSSTASFGLGYLAAGQGGAGGSAGLVVSSIPMTHPTSSMVSATDLSASVAGSGTSTGSIPSGGEVVGDSTTHAYYLPWCTQAGKISKANEVMFATEADAKSAGYTAGAACSGI
jgi:hypothetical protein